MSGGPLPPAMSAPRGGIMYPPSPYELARQQYAAQLVDDVRDVLHAELIDTLHPMDSSRVEAAAVAVVRLVYPTLQQVIDRDSVEDREQQAANMLDRERRDPDGDGTVQLIAGLLRDLRRLYDDAQNVRDQYGAETRRAHNERDAAQQELANLRDVVRRVRQITRHVRTGRG